MIKRFFISAFTLVLLLWGTDIASAQSNEGVLNQPNAIYSALAGKTLTLSGVAANTTMLSATGGSHTGSDATTDWNFATTWNTSGSPTAFQIAVTETAQGTSSLLMNLLGGASANTSEFQVSSSGAVNAAGNILTASTTSMGWKNRTLLGSGANAELDISSNSFSVTESLSVPASNTLHLGVADAASPVAQTLGVQNVVAGNANTAGANWTLQGSLSNGSGGGDILIQTTLSSAASGTQNTAATALTLKGGTQQAIFAGPIQVTALQSGTPATYACFDSSHNLISSGSAC
jgi:hypothetical protein